MGMWWALPWWPAVCSWWASLLEWPLASPTRAWCSQRPTCAVGCPSVRSSVRGLSASRRGDRCHPGSCGLGHALLPVALRFPPCLQGSVYQKVNAVSEIKSVGKDSFWARAEVSAAGRGGRHWGLRQAWSKPVSVFSQ